MQWLCFFYGVTFGGFVGFSSFLPIFFHDQYGLDMVTAGTLTAVCGLAGSIARPVGGHWADRVGGFSLLQVGFPAIGGLCILLAWLPPLYWAFSLNRHNPPSLGLRQRGRLSGGVTALPEHDGDGFGIYWRSRWSRRILPPILVWSVQGCDRNIRERISRLCRPDGNCHRQRDLHSTILASFDQRRSLVIQPSQAVCHGPPIDNTRRNPI